MVVQTAKFKQAITDSKKLKAKPTDDELLELYAFFKQGTQETKFEDATKPGAFDFKGKYKYNAWKKIVDEKVTPDAAQTKYVDLVEKLKKAYGFEA
ncbi:MAG: hypothetical protein Q9195_004670 [Heterodermia aff. obscurata]